MLNKILNRVFIFYEDGSHVFRKNDWLRNALIRSLIFSLVLLVLKIERYFSLQTHNLFEIQKYIFPVVASITPFAIVYVVYDPPEGSSF